jgi:hypothetical protein
MEVALRERNNDAMFHEGAGDHLAQVTAHLSGVVLDDIHPVSQFKGERALGKIGE